VAAYLAGRGARTVGLDLSPGMCTVAVAAGVPAAAADMTALPLRAGSLAGLVCLYAVIHLDARHRPRSVEVVSIGSLNASIVHPREVFKAAILSGAQSIILGHNHPSGEVEPSDEDLSITRRLVEVGELLGIVVLDHVIVGPRRSHFSMKTARVGGLR